MTSTPMASVWYSTSTPASERPLRKTPTMRAPSRRADDDAAAAEQAGAADDDGGDRVEVGVDAGVRAGRADAADQDPGGDREDAARAAR